VGAGANLQLVTDRGFFHRSVGKYKSAVLFSDNHSEMTSW
jgi:hypothetical protein